MVPQSNLHSSPRQSGRQGQDAEIDDETLQIHQEDSWASGSGDVIQMTRHDTYEINMFSADH